MLKIVFPGLFLVSMGICQDWTKFQLNSDFYSEGISAADFNKDGFIDIVAGPYIYPGPNFSQKKEYTLPKSTPFNTNGDTDNYLHFVYDMNGDGWMDILWQKRWDDSLNWFNNPKSSTIADQGRWEKTAAWEVVNNESPWFIDVTGDSLPEVVCFYQGTISLLFPDWSNPKSLWTQVAVTPNLGFGTAAHGLGVGDINGDGRNDILEKSGWWEQPSGNGLYIQHQQDFFDKRYTPEGTGGAQMHVYDVDKDGDNDVVTSLQAHGWDLAWFENLDSVGGSFTKHLIMGTRAEEGIFGVAFAQLHALEVGDINGDGLLDLITGKRKGAHGAEPNEQAILAWFELVHETDTVYYKPHVMDIETGVGTQIMVIDVNKDGRQDVLTSQRAGAFVFLNQFAQVGVSLPQLIYPVPSGIYNQKTYNANGQFIFKNKQRLNAILFSNSGSKKLSEP